MKKYFNCLSIFILFAASSFGQTEDESKLFTMIYTPGEKWNHEITFDKQPFFNEHSAHIQKLRKEGRIVIGGRYSNKGFMLLRAKDSIEANAIVGKDLSVANQIFDVELFEFNPFYEGCVGASLRKN